MATWVEFPLFIYHHPDGDFLLPTEQTISASKENIAKVQSDLNQALSNLNTTSAELAAKASNPGAKLTPEEGRAAWLADVVADTEKRLEELIDRSEKLKSDPKTTAYRYEIIKPSYGDYQQAKEDSNDWVVGEPRPNDDKLSIKCLANRVKLNGIIQTETDIKSIEEPMIGEALWLKQKSMMFPNPERLPFLSSPSTNS